MKKILITVLTLCTALTLTAADCYMDDTGDDANGGTSWGDAVLTLNKAITIATTPGDTIYIGDGSYSGAGVNVEINMPNDVNVVGDGPQNTTFVVTGDERAMRIQGNSNPATLYTGFKIDGSGRNTGWNNNGLLTFDNSATEINATISNVWFIGPYDGDNTPGSGTPNCRNAKGVYLSNYGGGALYDGVLTITHCLFEKLGMAYGCNDDYGDFAGTPYYVNILNCTFVNCNDTAGGTYESSTFTFRGGNTNRIYHIENCVMSDCQQDNTAGDKFGMFYQNATFPPVNVFLNNNLFYTNTIGKGANNMYAPNASAYNGLSTVVVDTAPLYQTSPAGLPYSLPLTQAGYGWSIVPEPGIALFALGALGLAFLRRK